MSIQFPTQIPMGQSCSPATFPYPALFGAEFQDIQASVVSNYSSPAPPFFPQHDPSLLSNLNFCNVSLAYTHPGQNDLLNVQVWLPMENWNGRMLGSGGGGFQAGFIYPNMAGYIGEGFSVVSTDAGNEVNPGDAASWALLSPGNVNLYALQNFASVSLDDAATIGKQITESFYGSPPRYSYWSGCSTGGRQGLMLAQRYPNAYDGILAAAPAINFPTFVTAEHWPQLVMNELGVYPHKCEFDALTSAAIAQCDGKDGLEDGIISSHELCDFDPYKLVGSKTEPCAELDGSTLTISEAAAAVAKAAWQGVLDTDESLLWPGLSPQAPLTGRFNLGNTDCSVSSDSSEPKCRGVPFPISQTWIENFVMRGDPTVSISEITRGSFPALLRQSAARYDSIIATNNPDLASFSAKGGKMITWHGLADQVIFPNATRNYYNLANFTAAEKGRDIKDFYRYYETPAVEHCIGGVGPFPHAAFDGLMEWVEHGVAPESILGTVEREGEKWERPICAFPGKAAWDGVGNFKEAKSWKCEG